MSFIKIHLTVAKKDFSDPGGTRWSGLNVREREPEHEIIQLLVRLVGQPYGWYDREQYHNDEDIDHLVSALAQEESRLWMFKDGREVVGFCCAANVETDLTSRFNLASGSVIEIYKIGLFDEYTKLGWGKFFVSAVLNELFKQYDTVYLNGRDTNHNKVIPFYEALGAKVIHTEILPDDTPPAP